MQAHYDIVYLNILEERRNRNHRARCLARQLSRFYKTLYIESGVSRHGLASLNLDVVSFPQSNTLAGTLRGASDHLAACRSVDFDILYLHKPWLTALGCALVARVGRRRIVIDYDGLDSMWRPTRLQRHLAFAGELIMLRLADLVITNNDQLRAGLEQHGYRVALARQGVDCALFDPAHFDQAAEKARLGLSGYQVFCLLESFSGANQDHLLPLLEAYINVERARRDAFLMVIGGGGPGEVWLQRQIERLNLRRVMITGRLPHEEVPRHLAAADFGLLYMGRDAAGSLVVPSKLLEYLAMELPVVGRLVGATAELLGKYIDASEPGPSLSRAMIRVFDGHHPPRTRRRVMADYDWNRIGDELRVVLAGLGGAPRP